MPAVVVLVVVASVTLKLAYQKRSMLRLSLFKTKLSTSAAIRSSVHYDKHKRRFRLQSHDKPERPPSIFEQSLQPVLVVMFLLYPLVTNVAFEGFPCYEFGPVGDAPSGSWLRADVSIECNTPNHDKVIALVWLAVIIYPVGIWAGMGLLLWRASDAVMNEETTSFATSVSFLYAEYSAMCLWWELMEMLRKFLLVGLFVILNPGSVVQIASGSTFCAAFLVHVCLQRELPH